MTSAQRITTYALSVIVGLTLLVVTGLTFLIEPMAEDLDLSDAAVELALVAPLISALLVVFVAGRAGDRFGERRTIVIAGMIFTVGAIVIAATSGQHTITLGLVLCGAGAAVIQGVALVSLIQILTYVSIAMEYFYEMSPLEASIAIAPAQVGAVLGAKVVAGRSIRRWGVTRSGRGLLLATGVVMLLLVFVQPSTPAWYLVLVSTAFSLAGMGALTVMNLDVMGRAPEGSAGAISAYRTAASSIGSALSMVVLGVIVLSSVSIAEGSSAVDETTLTELSTALRFDGVVGFLIALIGWSVLYLSARRNRVVLASADAIGRG